MVDTIKLRLKNIPKHIAIYNRCRNNSDVITYDFIANAQNSYTDEYKSIPDAPVFEFGALIEHAEVVFMDKKNRVERTKSHSRFNPSSGYTVSTFINKNQDWMEWEFSIPKYFYGTNIIQAVRNPLEREFILMKGSTDTFRHQRDHFFPRLLDFIEAFFKKEFPGCPIDYSELIISQIDVSFNQVFQSKRDALMYLKMQQDIKRKYDRDSSNKYQVRETSIHFGSKPYAFKIYHKGSEYEKNDRKKHEKMNKRFVKAGGKRVFDVDFFQEFSDKILRYEVSIRNQKLSYLYNERVLRKASPSFQLLKEIYNKLRSKFDNERLRDFEDVKDIVHEYRNTAINDMKNLTVIDYIVAMYKHWKKDQEIAPEEHEYFSALVKFRMDFDVVMNYTRKFYVALTPEEKAVHMIDRKTNMTMFETKATVLFDKEMFQVCMDFLWENVMEFKVEQKSHLNHYIEKVDEYNRQVEKDNVVNKIFKRKLRPKLDRIRMVQLLIMTESYSLDQAKKAMAPDLTRENPELAGLNDEDFFIEISKRKASHDRLFRKYQTELKAIGVTKQTLNEGKEIEAPLDFYNYYQTLNMNLGKWNVTNTPYRVFSK